MGTFPGGQSVVRVAHGGGAFLVADLVIGLAAFSTIALASLWMFSVGWIWLASEYHAVGGSFGAPWQLGLAWAGVLVCLPLIAPVVLLARASLRLPVAWIRRARETA